MKNLCKCCFINYSKNVFCNDCVKEGVSSFGKDVDIKTGEILEPAEAAETDFELKEIK